MSNNVTPLYVRRSDIEALVAQIKDAVYSFVGTMSVAEAMGAIEIAKLEIHEEARES